MMRELFGDDRHQALLKRGAELWRVVRGHPRYAYYGTVVSLSDPGEDTGRIMECLARIQGQGMCFYQPAAGAEALLRTLESRGLRTARSLFHRGGRAAYEASKARLARRVIPPGLEVRALGTASAVTLVDATAALCQSSGLSTMPGEVMRGSVLPGICLVALDADGAPVATASSYAMHAPGTPRGTDAFWGALATRPDYRGQGLAGLLGAMAIEHMWERHGMRAFNTGIKEENHASRAACAGLGVVGTEWVTAFCFDDKRLSATA